MKIVIDIPEEQYEIIKELVKKQNSICPEADSAEKIILNGTPLQKGHGRLIDADALYNDLIFPNEQFGKAFKDILNDAPTIIESESEEEE